MNFLLNLTILNHPFVTWAPYAILACILVALIAILFELRLPMQAYWGLPGHVAKQFAYRLKLLKQPPVWGRCTSQQSDQPLNLVAVELLDITTQQVLKTTYSDSQGAYGFPLRPGRYLLRASKSQYKQPSFINPENVEVHTFNGQFVTEVAVVSAEVAPLVDLALMATAQSSTARNWTRSLIQTIIFQLGHLSVFLAAAISLAGWSNDRDPLYGLVLVLCVVFLFIKLYMLRMIGILSVANTSEK